MRKITGCDCLSKDDKSAIIDALIIKESLIEDALKESKIEEQGPIDIRVHVPSSSLELGWEENIQLRNRVQETPICK